MKWRITNVNANIPAAQFYTVQRYGDYQTLRYGEVKEYQHFLKKLSETHNLEMGGIGDSYGDWQTEDLPDFAKQLNNE